MCCGKTLLWLKLPNSGDTLKLMIPNYSRKVISGWTNHSGMVTSYKMNENEMGYRGSKSDLISRFVKEQRVDGSYCIKATTKKMQLRCTLMGFERNYQVKIPSKQLNRFLSTVSAIAVNDGKILPSPSHMDGGLNPYFVSGFADAESYFSTTIYKNNKLTTGYRVKSTFAIRLNQQDKLLLHQLQTFFCGIGTISRDVKANAVKYSVDNLKDLTTIIIPHFKKYPLITQKAEDFRLFEQIVELQNKGAHITIDGLQQIINIKASMNLGISDTLKSEFKVKPVKRAIIQTTSIPDPNWVSGFVSGEGNFDAGIRKSTNVIGYRVYLRFRITQHSRDIQLIELIIKYLGAGRFELDSRAPVVTLVIGKFLDLTQIIIPFFKKYPVRGVKNLDFQDWCKIANLMTLGLHLTNKGFEEIRQIESGMNRGRKV
uniref:LAGLIDADG homing endonuclease n=1 Tax=Blastosporella zonata TaxID=530045 RepID=A0A386TXY8_9AGAR|nr:LAGLIDADG homing endonuclease [Blastosporella zonata]YP_009517210.1 LAGLIDADG homing endonuclease [Blastosporella zonata]AYE93086.1 LAGLIDADG homing endonuclease [Blastosporella zonata]AYE93087.1 LAGLIDADG homing endonuclease [Blastosporella zonata]